MPSGNKSGRFEQGADSRRGKGPPKGSGGAPTKTFVQRMRALAEREETVKRLERSLGSDDDMVFLNAFKEVANRGFGKAKETVEHTGEGGGPIAMTVTFRK